MATHRHGRDAPQQARDAFVETVRDYLLWMGDHEIDAVLDFARQLALYEASRRVWNVSDPVPDAIFEGLKRAGFGVKKPTMTSCAQVLGRAFRPSQEFISRLDPEEARPATPKAAVPTMPPPPSSILPPQSKHGQRLAEAIESGDLFAHLSHKLGLSQEQAAWRCGISVAAFRWLVEQGTLPKPRNIRKRLVWYRPAVDEAFVAYMNDEQREKDDDDEYAV